MTLFDKITALANEGRELTFRMTKQHLVVRLSDPRRVWNTQREVRWRDMMRLSDVDTVFGEMLDMMYRDHFRTRREAIRDGIITPEQVHDAAAGSE